MYSHVEGGSSCRPRTGRCQVVKFNRSQRWRRHGQSIEGALSPRLNSSQLEKEEEEDEEEDEEEEKLGLAVPVLQQATMLAAARGGAKMRAKMIV